MGLRITRHGVKEVLAATLLAGAICALAIWLLGRWPLAAGAVAGVTLAVWGWVVAFFRDPDRVVPQAKGLFVAASDGRVTDITPLGSDSALGRPGVQIGVFMSVFDVHVNRCPCNGLVEQVTHRKGSFLDVRDEAAWERNESVTIRMSHMHNGQEYPVIFRQIAGFVARRIVTDLAEGQAALRGERIGMIKFGSRTELLLPEELAGEVCVTVGQRVRAGQTVLAAAGRAANIEDGR